MRFVQSLALAVATSSIVCVILDVFLTDLIRRLTSRCLAMVLPASARRWLLLRRRGGRAALPGREERVEDALERLLRVVREVPRLLDRVRDLGVDLTDVREQLLLEVLHLVGRD